MPRTKVVVSKTVHSRSVVASKASTSRDASRNRSPEGASNRGRSAQGTRRSQSPMPKAGSRARTGNQEESKAEGRLGSQSDRVNRRFRAPESTLRNIRQYKQPNRMMVRKAPFQRLVRDIANKLVRTEEPLR